MPYIMLEKVESFFFKTLVTVPNEDNISIYF